MTDRQRMEGRGSKLPFPFGDLPGAPLLGNARGSLPGPGLRPHTLHTPADSRAGRGRAGHGHGQRTGSGSAGTRPPSSCPSPSRPKPRPPRPAPAPPRTAAGGEGRRYLSAARSCAPAPSSRRPARPGSGLRRRGRGAREARSQAAGERGAEWSSRRSQKRCRRPPPPRPAPRSPLQTL